MWEFSPIHWINKGGHIIKIGGWNELSGPGTVQFLDAVTQRSGVDAVFALR
jgi:hypothetical protein